MPCSVPNTSASTVRRSALHARRPPARDLTVDEAIGLFHPLAKVDPAELAECQAELAKLRQELEETRKQLRAAMGGR